MSKFKLGGYLPDPDVDSKARGQHRNKPDWLFADRLLPVIGDPGVDRSSDLRPFTSPRHNQANTGSCVAQSWIKTLEILRISAGLPHEDLSVLALYFQARQLMNPPQTNRDEGCFIWLAADCLRRFGVALESYWPFDPSKKYKNPGWSAMRNAAENKIAAAFRITGKGDERCDHIIAALAAGKPVVYGAKGLAWDTYRKGGTLQATDDSGGGHATTLVGWTGTRFIGENSWGRNWGENGFYFITPEAIGGSNCFDFWTATIDAKQLEG